MFANRYTALVDACSLVSVWRRNLLLSLAEAEFFRLRWSQTILDETEKALAKLHHQRGNSDGDARAHKAIAAMTKAFPEAMVEDFAQLLANPLGLPDPNDEHVIAAAVKTQAQAIVTENISDFPADLLDRLNLEARTADEFIADTIALEEGLAIPAIRNMRLRLKRPEMDASDLLRSFEAHGLFETVTVLTQHSGSI
ncbi:PIN domain-containing protein [Novosphingobium sp. KACC 22771]|uniref:PIN domain-containing protein n=1 Tax=Novosphingobium sp. KACC 22771 TaxID=3025670 RepID=UPI002365769A|nr:PIN domain-containing protein [Novosphingobium sp. KACC 22771]WDF73469.1 PIN domain-containing protein [Novosphingobium sp. KACC 22771]